ncbi:MAG: adenylate/guanylate cyclase domain-containing protein [Gammaproteobacteria bacterium]|nr:adenylate/guanylate cyclase domain-containing protein [Gammaproteobacteria bacterium]
MLNKINNKKFFRTLLGGVVIVLVILFLNAQSEGVVPELGQQLERIGYDQKLRWGNQYKPKERDPRIVIVDIDEKSLKVEGRWPWSREKIAKIIESVFDDDAAVVGLDVMFPEKERNPVEQIITKMSVSNDSIPAPFKDKLLSLQTLLDNDQLLANVLSRHKVVMGYTFSDRTGTATGLLPQAAVITQGEKKAVAVIDEMRTYSANLSVLQKSAGYAGFFAVVPDVDGIIREAPLIYNYQNKIYPSLALEVARIYFESPGFAIGINTISDTDVIDYVSIGGFVNIATNNKAYVRVPYRGEKGSYQYVSATDVLRGNVDKQVFQDAIVLVGTTAEGLYDLRSTPVDSVYPGVEIHANILSGILDGSFPVEPGWVEGIYIVEIIVLGVLLALIFPLLPPVTIVVTSLTLIVLHIGSSMWLWVEYSLVYPVTLIPLLITSIAAWNLVYGFRHEYATRKRLVSRFGQYVPPDLVDEMNKNPQGDFGLDGESREMTVLFADIRSFTTISESLKANDLKKMLNYFFTPMTGIIFRQRGTIDKYVGDMIMAFWGAPLRDNNHRANAIIAALAMLEKVKEMKPELKKRNWPEIKIGIGLNTGHMNVGDMGSEFRRAYTVIGDAVNLGSRLEGLTKFYGVELIVSDATIEDQSQFIFRKLDRVRVKGKHEAVEIYEPVCLLKDASQTDIAEINILNEALELYYKQDWGLANNAFKALSDKNPDRLLYKLYLDRIDDLKKQDLGDNWDGVYTHTSK